MIEEQENIIAVVGLGNIGLPLAIELGKKYTTIGFDLDKQRIDSLNKGINSRETNFPAFEIPQKLSFSDNIAAIENCNIYIIAVQTSVDSDGKPDINTLLSASRMIGGLLKKNDLIVYESTVYPGCTENVCVPILEQNSGLIFNQDFFVGYSPERINTADSVHTLRNTIKITAGSNVATAQRVDKLYKSIIDAGTYPVSSIKIAEAAKLLENAQRDINIAFMNNVANILSTQHIPFDEVLNASSSKWNFLKFSPGLVGGDCLPLASHYLNYFSDEKQNLLSISREINDNMPLTIVKLVGDKLRNVFPDEENKRVLILGIAYKPNTPSIKGSLVPNLVDALKILNLKIDVYDPIAEQSNIVRIEELIFEKQYHLILKATNHQIFENLDFSLIGVDDYLTFDINKFRFF